MLEMNVGVAVDWWHAPLDGRASHCVRHTSTPFGGNASASVTAMIFSTTSSNRQTAKCPPERSSRKWPVSACVLPARVDFFSGVRRIPQRAN